MLRLALFLLGGGCLFAAEVVTLTLREAVDLALRENPDVVLARLEEQRAEQAIRLARAPFVPAFGVGSGLAYSSGFPMSIEGSMPSILQARGIGVVFNRPLSYRVASARELRRGAAMDTASRQDEVMHRTADLYLQAQTAGQASEVVRQSIGGLERVLESVRARIAEGRELPIEARRAELALSRARYRLQELEASRRAAEAQLAVLLGLNPNEHVRTSESAWPQPALPATADEAARSAVETSRETRILESQLVARGLDVKAERAARLPTIDLVAQYGLLGRFNRFEDFFQRFQRHNVQLGVSFQLPVFVSPAVDAAASRAEAEAAQLRVQIRQTRTQIAADARRAFEEVQQAEAAREVARLDLEVARDQVSVLLALMQEGRAPLRQVEEARTLETERWIGFYDASAGLERARLTLLRLTGGLMAALR